MNIVYGKTLSESENIIVCDIANACNILFDTALLLFYRGIDSVQKAKKFLFPENTDYYNPFLLDGMKEAVDRISFAKSNNERILIFGDYDVDGICASSTLYFTLKEMGFNPLVIVPERSEGYGLNYDKIKQIKDNQGLDLIITVDCGISDCEKIDRVKTLGIDVIVTDHHEPPEILPNCIRINPKISGQSYPFDGLCGAGVAYKLSTALIGKDANKYIDLIALATVADSMDLNDENRKIVIDGLKMMNKKGLRMPLKYLLGDTNKEITAQTLSYNFAPRINAGGRMGDAKTALKMFISDSENEIYNCAVKLNEYNIERQAGCDEIYRLAKSIIRENELYSEEVIMVSGKDWKNGFLGIVAARLVEDYNRPVIVFSETEKTFVGSARSVDDINIYEAISSAKDYLSAYGGHSQAAGVTVEKEKFDIFKNIVCKYLKENFSHVKKEKQVYVDWKIESPLTLEFSKEVCKLEPFGIGNKKPVFSISAQSVDCKQMKAGSNHYSLNISGMDFLNFNGENDVLDLLMPVNKEIIFELDYSVYKGREYVKGIVKKIVLDCDDLSEISLYAFRNELIKLKFEEDKNVHFISEDITFENGFGTVYAVSDTDTVFDRNNLPIYLFDTPEKNSDNCIVISPRTFNDSYKKCIYLDKPLSVIDNGLINYVLENKNYKNLKFLTLDRNVFADIYNYLSKVKIAYKNSVDLFNQLKPNFNPFEFIFAFEVFLELGFFYNNNSYLKKDFTIKKQLEDSKIYSKIKSELSKNV
ncbi:MAG: single-stranded-DNA-specific exonuclease RecJ [Clostridia bacterium]|nr:single-stranded-DNA-specific exonuclease RecJ [Clostridia bacterium]